MLVVDADQLDAVQRRLNTIIVTDARDDLLDKAAGMIAVQTRRRIRHDKTTPMGADWEPWSDAYAETRSGGHSLGVDTGDMLRGVTTLRRTAKSRRVGSDEEYARGFDVRRQFLGLSPDNIDGITRELGKIILDRWRA